MADERLVPRDEARAALEARRELGPEYEDDLAERFAQQVEARLRKQDPARRLSQQQETGIVIVSILAAIPLVAIAGSAVGVPGIALTCLALVAVNYLVLRR